MRAVFFGTPAIAVPALRALAEVAEVVGVVCQPDRPAGRGLQVHAPAVKEAALALGLEVHQPQAVKNGALRDWIAERQPEVALVMAYGRILPLDVLEAPRQGSLNLHASLLPRYRGAAPINWVLINGESETGISLMRMDAGMDTGPVFCQRQLTVLPRETAGELGERLGLLAADVTRLDVPRALSGELSTAPQDAAAASYAPLLERSLSEVAWTKTALQIVNLVRGLAPRPGAHTRVRGKVLKLLCVSEGPALELPPGQVRLAEDASILVGTSRGSVSVEQAQLEGRRAAGARDLVNGRVLRSGDCLGI